jgi:hypothetical protein
MMGAVMGGSQFTCESLALAVGQIVLLDLG